MRALCLCCAWYFVVLYRLAMITGCVVCSSTLVESSLWAVLMTRLWGSGTTKTSAAWKPWVPMNILLLLWVSFWSHLESLTIVWPVVLFKMSSFCLSSDASRQHKIHHPSVRMKDLLGGSQVRCVLRVWDVIVHPPWTKQRPGGSLVSGYLLFFLVDQG